MSACAIRDAGPDDRAAIADVTRSGYEEFCRSMTPSAWQAFERAMNAVLEDSGEAAPIVADDDGRIVGSVFLYPGGSNAYAPDEAIAAPEFRLLAVAPNARGRGIGRALVQECIRRAEDAGATEIGLHTSASFVTAIAMYERMGFVRAPDRDFRPDGAELVMGYRLPLPLRPRQSQTR